MLVAALVRQSSSHIACLSVAAALAWLGLGGCATLAASASRSEQVSLFASRIAKVTPAGEAILQDGTTFKLAGIEMRTVTETEEPGLLAIVNAIITDEGDEVEVEVDRVSQEGVVYYRQRVHYFDAHKLWGVPLLWSPRSVRGSVNELLIVMGAARYVAPPEDGRMTTVARQACELAQEKAEMALYRKWRHRRLNEYTGGRCGQIYTNRHGYRARITRGDVEERDRHLLEYETLRATLTSTLAGPERVAALSSSLLSDNLLVRRFAARELAGTNVDADARNALTGALHDNDRYVRRYAAQALDKRERQ